MNGMVYGHVEPYVHAACNVLRILSRREFEPGDVTCVHISRTATRRDAARTSAPSQHSHLHNLSFVAFATPLASPCKRLITFTASIKNFKLTIMYYAIKANTTIIPKNIIALDLVQRFNIVNALRVENPSNSSK
jgi:hypothetical protein